MSDEQPQPPQPQSPQPQPPARPKVKSYLHKFYDRSGSAVKDPAVFEPPPASTGEAANEDEMRRLLSCSGEAPKPKRRSCHLRPVVWKAMLWIGVNCLIFGALGLAIAFFLPHEPELVELPGAQGFVRSRSNAEWNRSASVLRYVALGVFGVGALVTAGGLVLPSLVWRLFDSGDSGSASCGQNTESCRSSNAPAAKKRRHSPRRPGKQQPATVMTAATAGGEEATTVAAGAEVTAVPSLVDERVVQPARSPEGYVSYGQVK